MSASTARVLLVHRAPKAGAPLGHRHRERDVQHQRTEGDGREPAIELDREQADDERDLDQRGQDVVDRVVEQRLDRARAAFDVARDAAGLAFEVKAQAQGQQVLEGFKRHAPRNARGHRVEQELAQLGERGDRQPQRAIGQQQRDRHREHRARVAGLDAQRIDELLEHQRHADVGELGRDQKTQRHTHPPAPLPDIGQQLLQRCPIGTRRRGGGARHGGRSRYGMTHQWGRQGIER
jgi:hypothetical protein